jgi:hypothetical protein
MKPLIALLDNHLHAARGLTLLLEDHGCATAVGANWLRVLAKIPHVSHLRLILVEESYAWGGLAAALALRGATDRMVPILLMASGFDPPPDPRSVPMVSVVKTPTPTEVLWDAVRRALASGERL